MLVLQLAVLLYLIVVLPETLSILFVSETHIIIELGERGRDWGGGGGLDTTNIFMYYLLSVCLHQPIHRVIIAMFHIKSHEGIYDSTTNWIHCT